MSRGKVRPKMNGADHPGSFAWGILPNKLRGVIKDKGKIIDGPGKEEAAPKQEEVKG